MNSYPLHIDAIHGELRLYVHSVCDTHISSQIRERGIWEEYETHLLCRYLQRGDTFLDAGANIGYFTVIGAHRVGRDGQVFAFEPEPRNFSLLQANLALNGVQRQVHAAQAALMNQSKTLQLHLHPDNLGDHQVFPDAPGRAVIAVPGHCGADYLAGKVNTLNLVKIDTQGAEFEVVQGLLPLLQSSGGGLRMIVELTPFSLRAAGRSGAALINLLAQLDLPFAIIDHVEHQLVPCSVAELVNWCDNVDACTDDQGFMNIFIGQI